MRLVCMAKLSVQLSQQENGVRLTRKERVEAQQTEKERTKQEQREQAEYQKAKNKLENSTYENYEANYNSIDPKYKKYFISPAELKETEDYKKYQRQQKQREEIAYLIGKASKVDRGKPFATWGDPPYLVELLYAYREGTGGGSLEDRRARFLRERYPDVSNEEITERVRAGTITSFTSTSPFYALDKGEKGVIITKDAETGVIKREREYTKLNRAGIKEAYPKATDKELKELEKRGVIQYSRTDYIKVEEPTEKKIDVTQPMILDIEPVDTSGFGYVTRGTKTDQPRQEFRLKTVKTEEPQKKQNVFQRALNYEYGIPIFYGAGGSIKASAIKGRITEKKEQVYKEDIEKDLLEIEEKLTPVYQTEYQRRFDVKYGGKSIDYETAVKDFEESKEAKILTQTYQEEVEKELRQRRKGKITKRGFAVAGLSLAEEIIPTTPKELFVESAILGGGALAYEFSPVATNIVTGAIGGAGVITAVSPLATPEEKAGGVITAGISGGLLGFQGVRYLKRTKIKTEPIIIKEYVDPRLKKGFSVLTKSENVVNVIGKKTRIETFKVGQFSEQVIQGRRTIVTTNIRDILKVKPVYEGIPYQQKGKVYKLRTVRGDYEFKTPSGYQKATDLLVKRSGFTPSEAKEVLRYYQPKRIVSEYKAGVIVKTGDLYSEPVIRISGTKKIIQNREVVDKALGIKTRGAKPFKQYIEGEAKELPSIKGRNIYEVTYNFEKAYLTKEGKPFQLLTQQGKTTEVVKQITASSEKGEQILTVQNENLGIDFEIPFTAYSEQSIAKRILPKSSIKMYGQGESAIFKVKPRTETTNLKELLKNQYGLTAEEYTPPKVIKSDLTKLRDKQYLKEFTKTLRSIYEEPKIKTPKVTGSTGKTVASTIQETGTTQLRTTFNPVNEVKSRIKAITRAVQRSSSAVKLGVGSGTVLIERGIQKSALTPRVKVDNFLREEAIEKEILKSSVTPVVAQGQGLSQKQALKLDQGLTTTGIPVNVTSPVIPLFDIPPERTPPPPVFFPSASRKKKKGRRSRQTQELALLPDFTSRALGLDAEVVTERQAQQRLKKVLTGLEIRRGARIRY